MARRGGRMLGWAMVGVLATGCGGAERALVAEPVKRIEPRPVTAPPPDRDQPPLLDGMGAYHRTITTRDAMAQRLFDQGMVLAYGFNHAEAERSFRYAARLDPDCAMCWWGAALVVGPNINAKMEAADAPRAWAALGEAMRLAERGTASERRFIAALAHRYVEVPPADRAPLDQAYADAMCLVAADLPADVDAAVLCGEALMDQHPWDFWARDGVARPWTERILGVLERAMTAAPDHPGANHLYIHAVEASRDPGRALAAADRLGALAPGAGHLVHMPGHIYLRVGRYHDAVLANEAAIAADQAYAATCREQGIYPLAYKPHNWHFLWAAASFEGNSARAIEAALRLADGVPDDKKTCHGLTTLQHYEVTPLYAYVRFGKWDEIMAYPQPEAALPYPNAVWRYARAMAAIGRGELDAAEAELVGLRALAVDPGLDLVTVWDINTTRALIAIALELAEGELLARKKQWKPAIARLEHAAALERGLNYDEPPPWYYPVRHALGAVYLEAGRARDAERVYREDLAELPENGYALFGLGQALAAQKRAKDAAMIEPRFREAWQHADHPLTSSRY